MLLFSRVLRIVRVPFESSVLRTSSRLFEYSLDRLVKIDAMNKQAELQARAILLEQFKCGVDDVDVALEAVELELGPDLITHDSAAQFFQQFKDGNEDISDGASDHDSQLIRIGTFLNCKRAMCCELPRLENCTSTPIFGKNGRYQIYTSSDTFVNVLVDTFHGIKKKLKVNWKSALLAEFGKEKLRYMMLTSKTLLAIHHIDETNVIGTVTMLVDGIITGMMFCGKMDYEKATLDIEKLFNCANNGQQYIFIDPITTQSSLFVSTRNRANVVTTICADINLSNGNLALENKVKFSYTLDCPIIRNGTIFGFKSDHGPKFKKFVELSLADGTTEFDVKPENELKCNSYQLNSYLWIGNRLLVSYVDVPVIYEFDLTNRKWTQTTIEVEGSVRSMSIAGNVLILHSFHHFHLTHQFYRFPLEGKESPEIETWLKIRRRVLFHPTIPSRPLWFGDSEEALNDDQE